MNKSLLTNSLIFFVGNIVLSVFNYLYNTFMGRFLGPADYSILGSLLAFIGIIVMPTNAVATIAMRLAAHYQAKNDLGTIKAFLEFLTKRLGLLGLAVALGIAVLAPAVASYLHLPSIQPVILLAPVIILAILLPLNRGILQGMQQFLAAILNQGIDPLLKLILGVALVQLGFGVNGAVAALVIGTAVAYAASFLPLRPIVKIAAKPLEKIPSEVREYSLFALVAFMLFTVLMNVDILLVKHFLSDHQAGLYTALSNLGKIILFVTTPIVSVMFPIISDLQGRNEKHYPVLIQSFLMVSLIGLVGVTGYHLLPQLVVQTLYGSAYLEIAPYVGLFGLVMLLFSLVNLWVNYFLSIANNRFIWFLALSAIVEITLLSVRHQSFLAIVQDLLVTMIIGFAGLTGYYLFLKRQQLGQTLARVGTSNGVS